MNDDDVYEYLLKRSMNDDDVYEYLSKESDSLLAEEVAVLVAGHASDVFAAVEVVRIEHLLYRLYAPRQKTAHPVVLSLAVLAEGAAD
jgi:hypothetical protein